MQSVEFKDNLEDLRHSLDCGIRLLTAIRESMEEGKSSPDNYSDALYAAGEYLQGVSNRLQYLLEGEQ